MDRILGADRAIPENYRHAKINEARIDWLSGGSNYQKIITKAANEAGGQAFVTDYAGKSEIMDLGILDGKRHNTEKISKLTDPVAFLRAIQEDAEPAISGRTTIGTMALVEAAYLSAREGRAVALTETTPATGAR